MLWPSGLVLEYRLESDTETLGNLASFDMGHLSGMGAGAALRDYRTQLTEGLDLTVAVRYNHEELQLSVLPKAPLTVTSCRLTFERDFLEGDRALFNGYQSWTDTAERPLSEAMVGLNLAPQVAVDHWTLDGSGDYRFVDYPNQPFVQHGWTYAYFTRGASCELIASLDDSQGMTLLSMDAEAGMVSVEPECPQRVLSQGKQTTLLRMTVVAYRDSRVATGEDDAGDALDALGVADDTIDAAVARWFALSGKKLRKAPMLTGYTSWYRHYDDINEGKLLHDLEAAYEVFGAFDTCGHEKLFQIDDGYAAVGDWLNVRKDRFPHGLKPLAQTAAKVGFIPGLWMAPFVCEKGSRLAGEHPEWLLRDDEGNFVAAGSHWSGSLALDTRNREVRTYVTECVRTVTREWGFKLLKLDFLYAACMVPHDGMNRGQLMADALDLLRDAAGEDVLFLGCGVPLGPAFGRVEYCRIGCDVSLDWDDKPYRRLTERERPSTRNSLRNTVARSPLNGRAFLNDPDVVLLRADVALTPEQRQMVVDGAACYAGMLLTSDDMAAWDNSQRNAFQAALHMQQEANR